jgi:carbamoyl-phosphate synthase small subunit
MIEGKFVLQALHGSKCGCELGDQRAFSVQYHLEASPGPQASHYLFEKFAGMMG